jgi:serine/threonine-protein kinase
VRRKQNKLPDPLIGTVVAGRYRVLALLGEGGMGQVYMAEHEAIEKRVALKVLRAEYSAKPDIVTRFQQEAISASRIKHVNVLDVFDFGQLDNGCFFLAMELLEGNDLADDLVRDRIIEPARAVRIAIQICRALGAAHSRGVVHRDLKPENVFLQRTADGDEVVKIVDFGIAQLRSSDEAAASEHKRRRLTRTGMIFGTPEYMAPEQAAGRKADLRVDIYALGVILYEMVTGAVPFTGETFMAVLAAHLNNVPPSIHQAYPDVTISTELRSVIMRALAKDPAARFQSMGELASALFATPEGARSTHLPAQSPAPAIQQQVPGDSPDAPLPPASQHSPTAACGTPDHAASAQTLAAVDSPEPPVRQPGTETAAVKSAPKSRPALLVATALLMVAAGAAAVAFFLSTKRTGTPAPTHAHAQATPSAPALSPPASVAPPPASVASVAPAVVTPTTRVRLDVHTVPPGAVLFKDGAQVCDRTPCEVMAELNETAQLEAKRGPASGKVKVLAQREQKVSITLAYPAPAPRPKPPPRRVEQPKLCERFDEKLGIKIAAPCP